MPDLAAVLIVGLAGWRIASLLVQEDGPLAVFARIRRLVGTEKPGEMHGLAVALSCIWCASVWTCAALGLWLWDINEWWVPQVLAASAIAPVIHQWAAYE